MSDRAPTHQELMLYADGELETERVADVEAWLERSAEARDVLATFHELGDQIRVVADDQAARGGADGIAQWVMSRIEQERADNVVPMPSKVAAGDARSTSVWPVAFGALAAAAAIALVIWRFAGIDITQPAQPAVATIPSEAPELVVASAPAPAPDYDPEPTVSVDAVDFGARTGTIFYVPSDTGTTTVVWLSDDEAN